MPSTLDTVKQIFVSQIKQGSKDDNVNLEDPANDPNFSEAVIDRLRTQREEVSFFFIINVQTFEKLFHNYFAKT